MSSLLLYWTPDGFELDGYNRPGLPVLLYSATMDIEYWPTKFLQYKAIIDGRVGSHQTVYAHAHIMLPFVEYLASTGKRWNSVIEEDLAYYRDLLEGRHLGRPRVRRVMSFICDFYQWAYDRKIISVRPFTTRQIVVKQYGMSSRIGNFYATEQPTILPRAPKNHRLPRYFPKDDCDKILSSMNEERDRLIVIWALYTGAREHEICNLVVDDIPPQSAYRSRRIYPISIIRKRKKRADLYVPAWLLDQTYQYIAFGGRRNIVRAAVKRGIPVPSNIFLGRWGTNLKPNSVYKTYTDKLKELGLKGTFHALRHTYAINTLDQLMKVDEYRQNGGYNAILELARRLSHDSVTTTEVYLKARAFYLTDIYSEPWDVADAR